MKKTYKTTLLIILIAAACAGIYMYVNTRISTNTNGYDSPLVSEFKTYINDTYSYEFRYPENSVIYSSIDSKGSPVPPTNEVVCVSEGKVPPMVETEDGINDDPQLFCVKAYPNTTIDSFLKKPGIRALNVRGASTAVYNEESSEVVMQKGSNILIFSGSYFFPERTPDSFSDMGYRTFMLR